MRTNDRIVVIGTSAGGMAALQHLLAPLPRSFPAVICIVKHLQPDANADALLRALKAVTSLPCEVARDGQPFRRGHIYIAPADNHLLIKARTLLVTKGARENRYRPAIDPLFRSAAVTHGPRVISVVLTGMLDDGTEGSVAVKRCGGKTIVQDPKDAAYPDMPASALRTNVDHCLPVDKIAALLQQLVKAPPGRRKKIPDDVRLEAEIAERVLSDLAGVNALGHQAPYNCPNCGGVLWETKTSKLVRYRCHTGHSFTVSTLLSEQSSKIEETLWVMLRMLEERRNLLRAMRERGQSARLTSAREKETEEHIARVRALLIGGGRQVESPPRPSGPRGHGRRTRRT